MLLAQFHGYSKIKFLDCNTSTPTTVLWCRDFGAVVKQAALVAEAVERNSQCHRGSFPCQEEIQFSVHGIPCSHN